MAYFKYTGIHAKRLRKITKIRCPAEITASHFPTTTQKHYNVSKLSRWESAPGGRERDRKVIRILTELWVTLRRCSVTLVIPSRIV
jgi:hypothetical protein